VQYYWRARADTKLRIDWKVRHGQVTLKLRPKFHTAHEACLSISSAGRAKAVVHLLLKAEGRLIEEKRVAIKASLPRAQISGVGLFHQEQAFFSQGSHMGCGACTAMKYSTPHARKTQLNLLN
jgi:hypothetical protein